jgi:ornithine decarboxylase
VLQALPVDPARIRALVAEHGSPLLLLSTETVRNQYRTLQAALPGVQLHYALKPLPHPAVVQAIKDEGGWFDLATNGEVEVVKACGIEPQRCIHTHPIKRDQDIRWALDYGCTTFVFDNPYELPKFLPYKDRVNLLMRLSFRNKEAQCDLSLKFGVMPAEALALLRQAHGMGLKVRGLSFHAGSQLMNNFKYVEAINACRQLFNLAALEGIKLDTLDIGGGFPAAYTEAVMPINYYCHPIAKELERLFPGVRLIAEPGRFIAAPSMTLVASVMGKAERQGRMWYYLDDGLYGSYSGKLYDHAEYQFSPLSKLEGVSAPERLSVVSGPTCDSIDVAYNDIMLPDMACGDLVVSPTMGAYTAATATDFNFFPRAKIVVID